MGYMRHHAIVVTSSDESLLREAHREAKELCPLTTEVSDEAMNGYFSFMVPPDGSKEGWEESDEGDAARDALVAWLDAKRYEDGSTALDWVEVQFGDDDKESIVTRHSDEPQRLIPPR